MEGLSGGWSAENEFGETSSGTWIWGFSIGVLSESWEILALSIRNALSTLPLALPPLREASSWGVTEDRGREKKLLSHWVTCEDPRREWPRDRPALRTRRGWLLALWRGVLHS